ncbi:hypothetical protein EDB85DRAFT_2149504 [Lactarius pseudohatsudake]|nr:hypothetical protein EDB85DRAFT_2149504 [Lactarius pseudohatsudake]
MTHSRRVRTEFLLVAPCTAWLSGVIKEQLQQYQCYANARIAARNTDRSPKREVRARERGDTGQDLVQKDVLPTLSLGQTNWAVAHPFCNPRKARCPHGPHHWPAWAPAATFTLKELHELTGVTALDCTFLFRPSPATNVWSSQPSSDRITTWIATVSKLRALALDTRRHQQCRTSNSKPER